MAYIRRRLLRIFTTKFRGWQPAGPAEDGKTQVFRTSPTGVSNIFGEHRERSGAVAECLT